VKVRKKVGGPNCADIAKHLVATSLQYSLLSAKEAGTKVHPQTILLPFVGILPDFTFMRKQSFSAPARYLIVKLDNRRDTQQISSSRRELSL
jgi:hypothetical protein